MKFKPKTTHQESGMRDSVNLPDNVHRHIDRMSGIIANPSIDMSRYDFAIEHLLWLLGAYGEDDKEFIKAMEKIQSEYDGEEGKINKASSTHEEQRFRREKNMKILKELGFLMRRLNLGLQTEGSEEI